jgi:hypothetical protein
MAELLAGPSPRHIEFVNVGRDEPTGNFTTALQNSENKKYYREQDKSPRGYGRVWRPNF